MKKLLLGSVALFAISAGSAWAADLPPRMPVKAAPLVAPPVAFSWSGCYIGGHVGGGFGTKSFRGPTTGTTGDVLALDTSIDAVFPTVDNATVASNLTNANALLLSTLNSGGFDQHESGAIGGGQVGCNYQFHPNFVLGIEGDFSWSGLRGSHRQQFGVSRTATIPEGPDSASTESGNSGTISTFGAGVLSVKTDFLATITGRLGWVPWDRVMFYGKGGVAFAHDKYNFATTVNQTITASDSDCDSDCFFSSTRRFNFNASEDRTGWTVGGGIEAEIWGNWTAKLEYAYLDFGTRTVRFTDPSFGSFNLDVTQRIHEVKFGINYLFNWGKGKGKAPVVARY